MTLWKRDAERAKKNEEAKRANDAAQRHQDSANINRTILRLLIHLKAKTKQKNRHQYERRFRSTANTVRKWLTVVIVGIAAAFACGQWVAMNRQQGTMQGQLDQMVAQQRPWISAKVEVVRPVEFYEWHGQKGIDVTLHFSLKNYGPSPATNINIQGHIWPHPGNAHADILDSDQNALCALAQKTAVESTIKGLTIFPKDPKENETDVGIGKPSAFSGSETVLFSVQGCIDYTYGGSYHGKTGFRMLLGAAQDTPEGQWAGIPFYNPLNPPAHPNGPAVREVEMDQFKFAEDPTGGNYAK
jgi:hypothetical protein